MSTLLFIDTSEKTSFIALLNEKNILELRTNDIENDHSRVIHTQIEDVLACQQTDYKNLDGVIAVSGPGSYTGLRVGISSAKGICFGVDKPLIFISNFEKLAYSFEENCNKMTLIHARKNEFYACIFGKNGEILLNQQVLLEENIIAKSEEFDAKIIQFSSDKIFFTLATLVEFSLKHLSTLIFKKINTQEFQHLSDSEPNYIKEVYIYPPKK
ncbi:MAG: tRNA (adenosine(37)-N6)-threonylcarbamoyltransferase complex dimerization subunit type 1 TsaB [Chitinophagaceae bacterium]|nr:tRNA (adenosine(37)-N6)-threonylcarbamoyltransferase complex dimerization subunit type 1 TsaB [Chitinophagaceae bacterium]